MKTLLTLALILAVTIFAETKSMAVSTLYGANLSGVLTTEVLTSSTTSKYVTTVVNNATVINALLKTGTSGVLRASDMAIVYAGEGFGLDVINVSNDALLYQLAVSGTNQTRSTAILAPKANVSYYTIPLSDIEFTIPIVEGTNPPIFTGPLVTNWFLQETVDLVATTSQIRVVTVSFNGGSGAGGGGSTIFRGTITFSGKHY
jgi:hypothetical protein